MTTSDPMATVAYEALMGAGAEYYLGRKDLQGLAAVTLLKPDHLIKVLQAENPDDLRATLGLLVEAPQKPEPGVVGLYQRLGKKLEDEAARKRSAETLADEPSAPGDTLVKIAGEVGTPDTIKE